MNAPSSLMALRIVQADLRDPGEAARIESFVRGAGGEIFHRPAWLQAVARGTGQKACGLIVERNGSIIGWLPLTLVHSALFGRVLISSGFGVGGGILAETASAAQRLAAAAQELAQRMACSDIELRGGPVPDGWMAITGKHAGFVTGLASDDDAQLLAIPRKQRADIRKSLDSSLTVSVGRSEGDRAAHYAVYANSVRNLGTPVFPRSLFDAMLDAFEDADILTVRHDGVAVASVLSFYHGDTVMPYWGGGTTAARSLRANERMYFALMCHARRRGMKRFDFGRSKQGSGPFAYKKNWGFAPSALTYASWTAPGQAARDADPANSAHASRIALWRRLPLRLANRLGPPIARGLG